MSEALFRSVLVPTDFSESSFRAIDLAVKLLGGQGQITLLHVGVVPHLVAAEYGIAGASGPLFAQLSAEVNREQVERLRETARARVPDALSCSCFVREGYGPEEIVAQVTEGSHDLVVMGTHGRTGLQRALLGSVTERVVRTCPVPVLVTH
jgi:nucleotide-binding universal stress UspA family protein